MAGRPPDRFGARVLQISHDVKTAFDVAKPSVVSRILTLMGVHGHVAAALVAEMQDVEGSACFENCETQFRCSRCLRQGGVEAPVLWGRVAKYVPWKAEEKCKAKGWDFSFGGENENECVLGCMMWADNSWQFCDSKERFTSTVNDVIAELLELDTEPQRESLWRTSTHHAYQKKTLRVGNRGLALDLPCKGVSEGTPHRFHRDGMGSQGADRTLCKGMASWWRDRYIYRSKSVFLKNDMSKSSQPRVYSTALNEALAGRGVSPYWLGRGWESKIQSLTSRPKMFAGESWIGHRQRTALPCVPNGGRWVCRRWSKNSRQILDDCELGYL